MQLSKDQTALLQSYLNQVDGQVSRALQGLPAISNGDYETLREEFGEWKEAYEENPSNLYGRDVNNQSFQLQGIDQFPIPPAR